MSDLALLVCIGLVVAVACALYAVVEADRPYRITPDWERRSLCLRRRVRR